MDFAEIWDFIAEDSLRARRKAIVGCGRCSWQPQPARDDRHPERQRVKPAYS